MKVVIPAILVGMTISMTSLGAEESTTPGVIHLDHEKVAAAFARGTVMVATNNFKVQAGHRTGPGEVEVHDRDTDIFYIQQGKATFVLGGKAEGAKAIAPGETRAREIKGGEERQLNKGDIIIIPNGVPHWFKDVDGTFLYFVVKVTQ